MHCPFWLTLPITKRLRLRYCAGVVVDRGLREIAPSAPEQNEIVMPRLRIALPFHHHCPIYYPIYYHILVTMVLFTNRLAVRDLDVLVPPKFIIFRRASF